MTVGILQDIIEKVRELAGLGTTNQATDTKIVKYINSFYLYDLPDDLRVLKLKDVYTFNTIQGVDVYPFDFDSWSTVNSPAYIQKQQVALFQDKASFYGYGNFIQANETFATGDGTPGGISGVITAITQANPASVTDVDHGLTTGNEVLITDVGGMVELNGNTYTVTVIDDDTFTLNVNSTAFTPYTTGGLWTKFAYEGTTVASPIRRSVYNNTMVDTKTASTDVFPAGYPPTFNESNISRIQNILITANTAAGTLNVTDDGDGSLIGNCTSGTIDYFTGEIAQLTFDEAIPAGNDINIQYTSVPLARPTAILFYQNQFVLSCMPDQGYTVEIEAYREPSKALLGTTSSTAFNLAGRPEEWGWWELIAFGVAKKFYQDRLDMDGVQMMNTFIDEQISQARTKTYGQIGTRSIGTMFRSDGEDQNNDNYRGWGW